jgi:hypothetical protein
VQQKAHSLPLNRLRLMLKVLQARLIPLELLL